MRRILTIGGALVIVVLLSVFFVVPVFAQDATGTTQTPPATPAITCQNMIKVCQNGNYHAMTEVCSKIPGGTDMPCLQTGGSTTCPHQGSSAQTGSNDMMGGMMGGNTRHGNMMKGGMMGN